MAKSDMNSGNRDQKYLHLFFSWLGLIVIYKYTKAISTAVPS